MYNYADEKLLGVLLHANWSNGRINDVGKWKWTEIEMAQFGLFNRTDERFDDKKPNHKAEQTLQIVILFRFNFLLRRLKETFSQTREVK